MSVNYDTRNRNGRLFIYPITGMWNGDIVRLCGDVQINLLPGVVRIPIIFRFDTVVGLNAT